MMIEKKKKKPRMEWKREKMISSKFFKCLCLTVSRVISWLIEIYSLLLTIFM